MIDFSTQRGTRFTCSDEVLADVVVIAISNHALSRAELFAEEITEFIGYHATDILPTLSEGQFEGYRTVRYHVL